MIQTKSSKFILSLFAVGLLSACDATGRAGAEGSPAWNMRYFSSEAKNQYFTEKCTQYGYKVGTNAMRDCVAEERRNLRRR